MDITITEQDVTQAVPEEVRQVLDRCNRDDPDPEDVKALKEYLRTYPGLWRRFGDMTEQVAYIVLKPFSNNSTFHESMKQGRLELRKEFGFDDSSPFERMLIEHVVLCWLQMQITSILYSSSINGDSSLKVKDYFCRRLSAAQRRFLRACETLTRIRRMVLKSINTNNFERRLINDIK